MTQERGKTISVKAERVPGRVVAGRYVLAERLGAGGMAEVRAGHDERLARPVAVKLLRSHLAEDPGARRRFETEARAAARLSHPNIVTVFDTGDDAGVPFMVMERLPGRTLADEITGGPLPLDRALSVTDAVLSALAVAHDAGILHRDVKPGNVLLTEDGVPKVADFGIAKVTEYSRGVTVTMTGELLATPAYMAPERLEGAPSTPAGDLYSVGVLLYEMLAGARPFRGDTLAAVLDAAARGAYEPLRARRADVPEQVARVVDRALARDPSLRFASADEMARAVAASRDGADDATLADVAVAGVAVVHDQLPRTEVLSRTAVPSRATGVHDAFPSAGPSRGG